MGISNHLALFTAEQALQFVHGRTSDDVLGPLEAGGIHLSGGSRQAEEPPSDNLEEISADLIKHFATSTNLVFVNSRRTAEELSVRTHELVAKLQWPHDPFMIHHGSVAKDIREEAETALKSGVPTTVICSSTLEMGIDIGSVRAVGQIDPPWTVASFLQRLGRSGRREGEPAIMRLYVRETAPDNESSLVALLFPELLRGIALTRLMQQKWLEPSDWGKSLHLSTFVHQVFSALKQTGGMSADRIFSTLCADGPFRLETVEFRHVLRSLGEKALIEQLPTGEIILSPAGEKVASSHDFYAAFKGSEMYSVRTESSTIGELPFDALPPVGQLIILAGRRWLVNQIDAVTSTVWVYPGKGGNVPSFLGNGGDLHTRVVQEMTIGFARH